jgi:trans-aconitate 2-methyltransferase
MDQNNKIKNFYDNYIGRQKTTGINRRHSYIINQLKKNVKNENPSIIEIGCGIGLISLELAKIYPKGKVVGVDISEKSIEEANILAEEIGNVHFLAGNFMEEQDYGQFDIILLPDVIEHVPVENHEVFFKNVLKLKANGGKVLINIPSPFYLEYLKEYAPERLQIIDQPIHIDFLYLILTKLNFYISSLSFYSLWTSEPDYVFIVAKEVKREYDTKEEKHSYLKRLKHFVLRW